MVSFLLIGAIWINHHAIFRHIVRFDATLLVLNLLQLMIFAFLPFPTAVLAEAFIRGTGEGIIVTLYGGTVAVGALFVNAVWQYAARAHLLGAHLTTGEARQIGRRYLIRPLAYAAATVISWSCPGRHCRCTSSSPPSFSGRAGLTGSRWLAPANPPRARTAGKTTANPTQADGDGIVGEGCPTGSWPRPHHVKAAHPSFR